MNPFRFFGRNVLIVRGKKVAFVPRLTKFIHLYVERCLPSACLCTFSLIYEILPIRSCIATVHNCASLPKEMLAEDRSLEPLGSTTPRKLSTIGRDVKVDNF